MAFCSYPGFTIVSRSYPRPCRDSSIKPYKANHICDFNIISPYVINEFCFQKHNFCSYIFLIICNNDNNNNNSNYHQQQWRRQPQQQQHKQRQQHHNLIILIKSRAVTTTTTAGAINNNLWAPTLTRLYVTLLVLSLSVADTIRKWRQPASFAVRALFTM